MHETNLKNPKLFLKYIAIKYKEKIKEEIYKNYIAECLKALLESYGGKLKSYYELSNTVENEKKREQKTDEETIKNAEKKWGF